MQLSAGACSARGTERAVNQDYVTVHALDDQSLLAVIADGLGGYAHSEVASMLATSLVHTHIVESMHRRGPWVALLKRAVQAANLALWQRAIEHNLPMKTTLSALVCTPEEALLAHVGDCRIYVLRAGEAHLLTRDHSQVHEAGVWRWLLRAPLLTAGGQARHSLTRVLGDQPIVNVDTCRRAVQSGDRFVLCSDGIWCVVSAAHIAMLATEQEDDASLAHTLACEAQARGGTDDASAIVVSLAPTHTTEIDDRSPRCVYQPFGAPYESAGVRLPAALNDIIGGMDGTLTGSRLTSLGD